MRRISLLLVSLIVLTVQTTLAQTFSVKGTVMSADDNEPLIGATMAHPINQGENSLILYKFCTFAP